ncbi:hypothetical protein AX17_004454 [Amanita inopinata Kibby_2008]|nr:hypothetical protein AX17_004454 [Amanita inopinata Kibby_2008]
MGTKGFLLESIDVLSSSPSSSPSTSRERVMLDNGQMYIMQEDTPLEIDLCNLLQNMKLQYPVDEKASINVPIRPTVYPAPVVEDIAMPEETSYHSDGDCSSQSSGSSTGEERHGCAYLQSIQAQLDSYATTGGGYLEAIFTHREILAAYPAAHQHCSRAFSDIAYALEQRAWRADREADSEAVAAFRHEAWVIAASRTASDSRAPEPTTYKSPPFVCMVRYAW